MTTKSTNTTNPKTIDCKWFYETGKCKFGNTCRYTHINKKVCYHYSNGHCNYGNSCLLSHNIPDSLPFDYHCFTYYCIKDNSNEVLYTEKYFTRDALQFHFYDKKGNKIIRSRTLMYGIFNKSVNVKWRNSILYSKCIKVAEDYIEEYNINKNLIDSTHVLELREEECKRSRVNLLLYGNYDIHHY